MLVMMAPLPAKLLLPGVTTDDNMENGNEDCNDSDVDVPFIAVAVVVC